MQNSHKNLKYLCWNKVMWKIAQMSWKWEKCFELYELLIVVKCEKVKKLNISLELSQMGKLGQSQNFAWIKIHINAKLELSHII